MNSVGLPLSVSKGFSMRRNSERQSGRFSLDTPNRVEGVSRGMPPGDYSFAAVSSTRIEPPVYPSLPPVIASVRLLVPRDGSADPTTLPFPQIGQHPRAQESF